VADVERRIKDEPERGWFGVNHLLLVPNMSWRIVHHFQELEGTDKVLLNPSPSGLYLGTAVQTIVFRMDRAGAEVASEAHAVFESAPASFKFNRPFHIFMKKRGGTKPFFVMWVENAELMQEW